MKKTAAIVLALVIALNIKAHASGVTWGAANDNGVADVTGTVLPIGDLVEVGGFKTLSNSQVTLDMAAGNVAAVLSDFQVFGTDTIGDGTGIPGYWFDGTVTSANALSLQNKSIYYFVFNSATTGSATQYGIFTGSNNSNSSIAAAWTFPDDSANPNTTATDIDQVQNPNGILWGTFGPGSANGFTTYDLAPALSVVPEPSTISLMGSALAGGLFFLRRRRS